MVNTIVFHQDGCVERENVTVDNWQMAEGCNGAEKMRMAHYPSPYDLSSAEQSASKY